MSETNPPIVTFGDLAIGETFRAMIAGNRSRYIYTKVAPQKDDKGKEFNAMTQQESNSGPLFAYLLDEARWTRAS